MFNLEFVDLSPPFLKVELNIKVIKISTDRTSTK